MNAMVIVGIVGACVCAWTLGLYLGERRARRHLVPKHAATRDDEMLIVHESIIDGDALRFTVRTRQRKASFLVPREMVYQMSDDLMRAAAQLGKREQVQRGIE